LLSPLSPLLTGGEEGNSTGQKAGESTQPRAAVIGTRDDFANDERGPAVRQQSVISSRGKAQKAEG